MSSGHARRQRRLRRPPTPEAPPRVSKFCAVPPGAPDRWKLPGQVSAAEVAFPGRVDRLVPPAAELVPEGDPWVRVASQAFFKTRETLRGLRLKPEFCATEPDRMQTLMTLNVVLGSFQHKHEIKLRQAATLMKLWCEAPP